MKDLIRHILKETTATNELLKVINREGIFSVAKLVGGIDNLKSLFKDNPAVLERIGGANGIVRLTYDLENCPCIDLKFDIIDEHWNIWASRSWGEINVKYDESKLTKGEINFFNAFIVETFEMEGSFTIEHFDCPELEKKRSDDYIELVEINGVKSEESFDYLGKIDRHKVQQIIDKLKD
jgi:hypothetical protein